MSVPVFNRTPPIEQQTFVASNQRLITGSLLAYMADCRQTSRRTQWPATFRPGLLTRLAFRHHGHNLMPKTCALLSDSRQNLSIFGHDADVTKNRWGGSVNVRFGSLAAFQDNISRMSAFRGEADVRSNCILECIGAHCSLQSPIWFYSASHLFIKLPAAFYYAVDDQMNSSGPNAIRELAGKRATA